MYTGVLNSVVFWGHTGLKCSLNHPQDYNNDYRIF